MKSLEERFWSKVDVCGPDECWEWMAGKTGDGYGAVSRGRKCEGSVSAHRAVWELIIGPIPDGFYVLHHCGNKGCVNPGHLFLGTGSDTNRMMLALVERFWPKVDIRGPNDCWEWLANKVSRGYGQIYRAHEKYVYAHRVVWELTYGPIPEGLFVCHHCDNPGCVNPNHLFLGTNKDNMVDCVEKGRSNRGQRNGQAKLIEKQVLSIREEYARNGITQEKLAIKHNVKRQAISKIINRERWAHI